MRFPAALAWVLSLCCLAVLMPHSADAEEPGNNDNADAAEEEAVPRIGEELLPEESPESVMVESPDAEPPPTEQTITEDVEDEELYVPGEEAFVALLLLALVGFVGIRIYLLVRATSAKENKPKANPPDNVNEEGAAASTSPPSPEAAPVEDSSPDDDEDVVE